MKNKPKDEQGEEEEVITCKEFLEKHQDIKEEKLHKIVLVCKNCGHKDLLKNFLKDKGRMVRDRAIRDWGDVDDDISPRPFPKPLYPKPPPYNPKWGTITCENKTKGMKVGTATPVKKNKMMLARLEHGNYEDMFYCPKCGSSLIVLCKEFLKNNVAELL